MREEMVEIKGIKSNVKIGGKGKPLLILHGWGGSSCSWTAVQRILLKQGYLTICPDLPGFGKSEIPPKPWTVDDYVDWTLKLVDYFKFDEFYLVSHSFGGRIAIKFAAYYPKRLKKMVLCGPAGIKTKPDLKANAILATAEIGNVVFSSKVLRAFKNVARSFFYLFLRHRDYVKAKGPMRKTMKKVLKENLFSYLSKIGTRTLIVWGEEDKMVPVRMSAIFRNEIKNSTLEILAGNGHSPHLGTPGKLSKIIIKFLKS